jgi:micrococcal nuclease
LLGCATPAAEEVGGPRSAGSASARVTEHTDGDTLWLSGIGKVRLIGVDTPEVYPRFPASAGQEAGGGVECYGREASAFVERTVPIGSEVRYRLGVDERDRYGRALAYVWLRDGRFLNRLLVARGYAQPLTVPPNVDYEDEFVLAARRARQAGRGLWGRPGCSGK